jgi:hypothetical protein
MGSRLRGNRIGAIEQGAVLPECHRVPAANETLQRPGSGGTEMSRSQIGNLLTIMYTWPGSASIGANMNAMVQNDHLISKDSPGCAESLAIFVHTHEVT